MGIEAEHCFQNGKGENRITRQIEHFNLDAVISVLARDSLPPMGHPRPARRVINRQLRANARELEAALQLVRKVTVRLYETFVLLQRLDGG